MSVQKLAITRDLNEAGIGYNQPYKHLCVSVPELEQTLACLEYCRKLTMQSCQTAQYQNDALNLKLNLIKHAQYLLTKCLRPCAYPTYVQLDRSRWKTFEEVQEAQYDPSRTRQVSNDILSLETE